MSVKETGSIYRCEAFPYNQQALTTKNASLKTDTSAAGATVQEVLQTGSKSLQAVLNQRLQQLKKDGIVNVPDQILILFPNDYSSSNSGGSGNAEQTGTATAATSAGGEEAIYKKLKVTRSSVNQTLIQGSADCNELGRSPMGFDQLRKGTPPVGKDNQIYNSNLKVNVRANNTADQTISDFKFRQDTDIPNAINQVLLQSKFAIDTLGPDRLTKEGFRKWWKIDVQTYNISTTANDAQTGTKPKLIVYRVIPYKVHSSTSAAANVKAPGFDQLKKQAVKRYDYLYTGKNVDIRSFEIKYENSFSAIMAADGLKKSQDVKTAEDTGGADPSKPPADLAPTGNGKPPEKKLGVNPTQVSYTATSTKTDKLGGSGTETEGTRAARLFHDAINKGTDMMNITLDIIGDPYYIAQSGTGNYTAKQTQYANLNADGTVNYQNGEVDILINFRTPIDINQTTGLYNFGGATKSAPVMQFSGLYRITNVTSNFKGGVFTQTLDGIRRPQQEATVESKPEATFNTKAPPVKDTRGGAQGQDEM
jgi:hypothetical protein